MVERAKDLRKEEKENLLLSFLLLLLYLIGDLLVGIGQSLSVLMASSIRSSSSSFGKRAHLLNRQMGSLVYPKRGLK